MSIAIASWDADIDPYVKSRLIIWTQTTNRQRHTTIPTKQVEPSQRKKSEWAIDNSELISIERFASWTRWPASPLSTTFDMAHLQNPIPVNETRNTICRDIVWTFSRQQIVARDFRYTSRVPTYAWGWHTCETSGNDGQRACVVEKWPNVFAKFLVDVRAHALI